MPVRLPVLTDRQAILDIWRDNLPSMRQMAAFQSLPDWDLQTVKRRFIDMVQANKARVGVWMPTPGGEVQAVLFVLRLEDREEAVIWLVKFVRRANGTVNQAATVTRFETSMTDLIEAWARTAKADGVTRCDGWYPLDGHVSSLAFLDNMTTNNGVAPDLTSRPGWRGYSVTPDQLIIGVGRVP